MHDLRASGWSLSKIANEVGCTVSEVIASLSRQAAEKQKNTEAMNLNGMESLTQSAVPLRRSACRVVSTIHEANAVHYVLGRPSRTEQQAMFTLSAIPRRRSRPHQSRPPHGQT